MSQGKQNLLASILAMAALSSLNEESEKNYDPKSFDELLDKIFGSEPKKPAKDKSGSMKPNKATLFDEILNEISEDADRDYLNSIHSSLKDAHKQEINYIGKTLLPCEIKSFENVNFLNVNLHTDAEAKHEFGNERVFYTLIYGGFGIAFLGGSVHYICLTKQPNTIILFDNKNDFYYGRNICSGLKDKIKKDHLSGKLK